MNQAAWLWLVFDPGRLSGFARGSSSANSLNQAALSSFLGPTMELGPGCGAFGALMVFRLIGASGPSRKLVEFKS